MTLPKPKILLDQFNFEKIKQELDTTGYIIIKDFPTDNGAVEQAGEDFETFCEQIAKPIGHDAAGKIVWDIKSKPPEKTQGVVTFSEHNYEAELHTDSQYSENPEDYFGLLSLKKAKCGGGQSYLLSVADIIRELNSTAKGKQVLQTIQNTRYPFIVPNVFKKNKSSDTPEFSFAPLLQNGKMRYRVDTIEKAIAHDSSLCTAEQLDAFNFLKQLINNSEHTQIFTLEEREVIMINNKTMLHGRSSFTDYDRHLLRIRMSLTA